MKLSAIPAHRAMLLVYMFVVLLVGVPSALAGNDLPFVDGRGENIPDSSVPEAYRLAVRNLPVERLAVAGRSYAVILAHVVVPSEETNFVFSSTLVGKGWNGGMHYFSQGGMSPAKDLHTPVCIRLLDFSKPSKLVVSKMGYKTVELPVPFEKASGKIVWMGDIPLTERYSEIAGPPVRGQISVANGGPLVAPGEATLRVNGTADKRTAAITDGAFEFSHVPPGKYLVEFWIEHYAVPTWWLEVPEKRMEPIEKKLTAFARQTLHLRLHTRSEPAKNTELECGLPYKDAYLDVLEGEKLRVDQEGDKVSLYSPRLKIAVAAGPFKDLDSSVTSIPRGVRPWFSWIGPLKRGDVILLLSPKDRNDPNEQHFDAAQVSTAVEVLAND